MKYHVGLVLAMFCAQMIAAEEEYQYCIVGAGYVVLVPRTSYTTIIICNT